MGNWNSGRRPKYPTELKALKVVRGRPTKGSRWRSAIPKAVGPEFDTPPTALDGNEEARTEWARIAPILRECGYVSSVERAAMIACCQLWSIYIRAQQAIQTDGMTITRENGNQAPNPHHRIANDALHLCRQIWTDLGLTPVGRARNDRQALSQELNKAKSKWAGLLP